MLSRTREFIKRAYKSDASILIFFKKIGKADLIVKKTAKKIPHEESPFEDEIVFILGIDETRHEYIISYDSLDQNKISDIFINGSEDSCDFLQIFDPIDYDLKNYYKLLQKQDFVLHFYVKIFESDHYRWLQKDFYGLVIEQKDFSWKQSDYGSDNTQIYVFANSKYFRFRCNTVFSYHIKPRDFTVGIFEEMKELGEKVYDYFFENKQFILVNFDEHELRSHCKVFFDNRGHLLTDKKYMLPREFVEDLFIVSTQMNNQK